MVIDRQHPHHAADQLLEEWRVAVRDCAQRDVDGLTAAIDRVGCKRSGCVSCRIVRGLAELGLLMALCSARDLESDRESA